MATKTKPKELAPQRFGYGRQECADYLGISVRTLDGWVRREDGPPYIQYQQKIIFPRVPLEKWLERNMQ